jgi:hypothetical protein
MPAATRPLRWSGSTTSGKKIKSAFLALRCTQLDGQVLRSGDRPRIEQELWALLTLYQLLRMAMTNFGTAPPPADS